SSGFTSKDTRIRSDEHSHPLRLKRSAAKFQQSNSLVVETLVVADKKMVEKHGKESVTTYILTVMNMVRYYLFILYFVDLSNEASVSYLVHAEGAVMLPRRVFRVSRLQRCEWLKLQCRHYRACAQEISSPARSGSCRAFSRESPMRMRRCSQRLIARGISPKPYRFRRYFFYLQVSSLFKDGTIGSDINIVVVSLLLLEDEPSGLKITHHADQSLNNFCQWQSSYVGKNGKRHDHAILLTGLDICSWKNEPCDTLDPRNNIDPENFALFTGIVISSVGFAPINGMCSKFRSCTINEDTGLGLAFTIAHESGHNFGMVHDGEGNPCRKTEGNIMSPTLSGNNGVFSWSACSRQYLKEFLSTAQSSCLIDEPKQLGHFQYPEKLPGQIYDADTQCKWQFGPKAKQCSFVKWCRRGQCVRFGDHGPKSVVGGWSDWTDWSECSRTCGGGVMYQERFCNNPVPQYGGKYCQGSNHIYQICNAQTCPSNTPDFRAQQCAEYNSKPFRGWYYKWKPYTTVEDSSLHAAGAYSLHLQLHSVVIFNLDFGVINLDPSGLDVPGQPEKENICKLYCTAEDFDFFFALSNKVKDGTPCSASGYDVCIDGSCELVGCDYVLGSKAALDACGVCKGDNSTCKFYRGQYLSHHKTNGVNGALSRPSTSEAEPSCQNHILISPHYCSDYYTVVTIPAGARSIHFQEMEVSTSYLAVRNLNKKYYLTGDWTIDWPGKFSFAGTVFNYQRPFQQTESLYAPGPTNETLVLEVRVYI
ncbi:hypothetical protein AB205_0005280, partial [Aquarana catesbeiana]